MVEKTVFYESDDSVCNTTMTFQQPGQKNCATLIGNGIKLIKE